MNRITVLAASILLLSGSVVAATRPQTQSTTTPVAQQQASRDATREKVRALLDAAGPQINVAFRQSTKNPYNFTGILSQGLTTADRFEIVMAVTNNETIEFRIFPHYKGAYVNVYKAANPAGLMRQMLRFSDKNFLLRIGISFSRSKVRSGGRGVQSRPHRAMAASRGAVGVRAHADLAVGGRNAAASGTPGHASGPRARGPGTTGGGDRPRSGWGTEVGAAGGCATGGRGPGREPDARGSGR